MVMGTLGISCSYFWPRKIDSWFLRLILYPYDRYLPDHGVSRGLPTICKIGKGNEMAKQTNQNESPLNAYMMGIVSQQSAPSKKPKYEGAWYWVHRKMFPGRPEIFFEVEHVDLILKYVLVIGGMILLPLGFAMYLWLSA